MKSLGRPGKEANSLVLRLVLAALDIRTGESKPVKGWGGGKAILTYSLQNHNSTT